MTPITKEMLDAVGATPLERAVCIVESGHKDAPLGDLDAIGDKHLWNKAHGPMQIRKPYVDDVNRVFDQDYRAEDCQGDLELSIKIFRAYMLIWATPKRIGRAKGIVTDEDRARCHNGGPRGFQKPSTIGYWEKIRPHLPVETLQENNA